MRAVRRATVKPHDAISGVLGFGVPVLIVLLASYLWWKNK